METFILMTYFDRRVVLPEDQEETNQLHSMKSLKAEGLVFSGALGAESWKEARDAFVELTS